MALDKDRYIFYAVARILYIYSILKDFTKIFLLKVIGIL